MLKLWIVGASGQIGSAINEVLDPLEMEVFNTDKEELDITDTDEVLNFGVINRPVQQSQIQISVKKNRSLHTV